MGQYRASRNIEASLLQFIEEQLIAGGWSNISVEKSFARIYKINLPSICVRCENTEHLPVEIGGNATKRKVMVFLDVFGSSDGNRLDLKDFLVSVLKAGFTYYNYEIENGIIKTKIENGRLRVLSIGDNPVNFDSEPSELDLHDRYRQLLILDVMYSKAEA